MNKCFFLFIFIPALSYADTFGNIRSNDNIALATNTVSASVVNSSNAVSYVGISSLTAANGIVTISSQSASNVVNQGQYMFQSSQAASNVINQGQYLFQSSQSASNVVNQGQYQFLSSAVASNLVDQSQYLQRSSAAVSYVGVSTLAATAIYSPYGARYSFTTTTATLNVGGSSITITIGAAGTYLLIADANLNYTGATFAAAQVVTLAIYRQNNTPGVIPNTLIQGTTRIITAITDDAGYYSTPIVIYTTANSNDVLSFHASITATPSAGSFQASKANLFSLRIK